MKGQKELEEWAATYGDDKEDIRASMYDADSMIEFAKYYHKEQLNLSGVVDSLTDKEKIDYEIAQKRKESEDNIKGWLYAMFFTLVIIIVGFNILKSCSS